MTRGRARVAADSREPVSDHLGLTRRYVWPLPLRLPPQVADPMLAVGVAAFAGLGQLATMHEHVQVPVLVIVVAMGLVLVARRRFPGVVLAAVVALTGCLVALRPGSEAGFIAVLISSYSAAVYGTRRLALGLATAAVVLLAASGVAAAVGAGGWYRTSVPLHMLLAAAGAWVVGWVIRGQFAARAAQLDLLAERAALAAERQREEARRVRLTERLRIARELHDIVAHHITVAVIQAQGAQRIAERDPARARKAMAETESTARSALDEMRRLLGLLRSGESDEAGEAGACEGAQPRVMGAGATREDPLREPERAALPGLADIGALAERVRAAGVDVTVRVTGQADGVPDDIGLATYRIVQEALTNVLKHAGNARATVRLDFTDGVEITVTDDGRGAAAHLDGASLVKAGRSAASQLGSGGGITGMTERAAAAGGTLTAGPRQGGGFEVHAVMPPADL
jgi:signal transduction histidine kinase